MSGWTDERINTLTKLWADGLSASECARRLGGFTSLDGGRSAVIGKVHRLKLPGRATASRAQDKRRKTQAQLFFSRPSKPEKPVQTKAMARSEPIKWETGPEGGVSLLDLGPHQCKFPLGKFDEAPERFCGAPREDHLPYCPAHSDIAYQPRKARKEYYDLLARRAARQEAA